MGSSPRRDGRSHRPSSRHGRRLDLRGSRAPHPLESSLGMGEDGHAINAVLDDPWTAVVERAGRRGE